MFYFDPNPNLFLIPWLNWPITWYGILFALGFGCGFFIFKNILVRYLLQKHPTSNPKEIKQISLTLTDRLNVYLIVATILGARLGHFLFYEDPKEYLQNPLELLKIREGGLASHGAAIAILIALWILSRKTCKIDNSLTWLRLLDFVCVPTAFAASLIRFGNFINQEITGTPTNLPWAITFGHPLDGSARIPRHPVQLYEAIFYLIVFFVLWRLTYRTSIFLTKGRLIGLFLLLVFGFRLCIEILKLEQSRLLAHSNWITMGQWLSIPFILLGTLLLLYSFQEKKP